MNKFILIISFICIAKHFCASCSNDVIVGSYSVSIDGQSQELYVAQSGGVNGGISINGNSITFKHNVRGYLAADCVSAFEPNMYKEFKLMGKTLHMTLDISKASCGCNVGAYLTSMPAYGSNQQPDKTHCGDYYCDANSVCGVYCPEIDLIESNTASMQVTPHKCSAPSGKHYNSCDRGGYAINSYKTNTTWFGPKGSFIIDTSKPFSMATSFIGSSSFSEMITTVSQGQNSFNITHTDSTGYLGDLTTPLKAGMVLIFTSKLFLDFLIFFFLTKSWGSSGGEMSWLDVPPCKASQSCSNGPW